MATERPSLIPGETAYAIYFTRRLVGDNYVRYMRDNHQLRNLSRETGNPYDDWRNVVRHGLIQGMAADVLSERLGISSDVREALRIGCFIHDVDKKFETSRLKSAVDGLSKIQSIYDSEKHERGVLSGDLRDVEQDSEKRVRILQTTEGVGLSSLMLTHELLEKGWDNLTDIEKAQLIIHATDDTTGNDEIIDFRDRIARLYKDPKKTLMIGASRDLARVEFGNIDLMAYYGEDIIGPGGLTNDDFADGKFPDVIRVQEVMGIKLRQVIADVIGVPEPKLNKFITDSITERQLSV